MPISPFRFIRFYSCFCSFAACFFACRDRETLDESKVTSFPNAHKMFAQLQPRAERPFDIDELNYFWLERNSTRLRRSCLDSRVAIPSGMAERPRSRDLISD